MGTDLPKPDLAADDEDPPSRVRSGELVAGRYRLKRLLGRGGMGEVHEAEHVELARRVAVKILITRAGTPRSSMTRIKREARTLAALSHPNIVQILDAGEHHGTPFLAMELLEGEDLRTRLDREGRLSVADAVAITSQILAGLDAVHASGMVHRDVKPENVFLTRGPDGDVFVKLLDFGVSKLIEIDTSTANLTESGTIVGSPAFMAPEQAIGSSGVDARTDLYSVGAVLYTMLAGRPPFVAPNIPAVLLAIVEGRSQPLGEVRPGLPTALVELIGRAMDRERGKRFRSAAEFAAALVSVAPTGVQLAEMPRRPWRRAAPYLGVALVGLACVLALAASGGTHASRGQRADVVPRRPAPSEAELGPETPEPVPAAIVTPVRRARLRVEVLPARAAAARVTLDGEALPREGTDVEVGERERVVRVEAPGWQPFETRIRIDDESERVVKARLDRRPGPGPRGDDIYQGPMPIRRGDPFP